MPTKAVVLGYIVFAILAVLLYLNWQIMAPRAKEFIPQPFVLEKGEGVKEISLKLRQSGLIKNEKIFQTIVFFMNLRKNFWPGRYDLSPDMDLIEIIKRLTSRPRLPEVRAKIIEGWTNSEVAKYLEELNLIESKDFLSTLQNNQSIFRAQYNWLQDIPENINLEGFLFPDTYLFFQETNSEEIINKMLDNFGKKVTVEILKDMNNNHRTLLQTITMASLIEKEAADDVDRRKIADVFWRRLDNNIALQSCASINYILGTSKFKLSFTDTRTPSSYNTYLHRGLPPGPINNPSLSSIRAATYPLVNDYWFFLATADGETIFSRTKDEHDKNKAIYLK